MSRLSRCVALWVFIFSMISLLAHANENKEVNFNKKLEEALSNLQKHKSFELSFQQELYSTLRNKTVLSQGTIKIKAPASFRFELQKPRNELYVSNGVDFWKFIPELKHAQHLKANSLELNYISLLMNPAGIKKVYKISRWVNDETKADEPRGLPAVQSDFPPAESAENMSIKLEPKGDNPQKVLYAILNVRRGLLNELRLVQMNGNRVRLLFSNSQDKAFDEKTFSFIPPPGIVLDSN